MRNYTVRIDDIDLEVTLSEVRAAPSGEKTVIFTANGRPYAVTVAPKLELHGSSERAVAIIPPVSGMRPSSKADRGDVVAPMPGIIVSVKVALGDRVASGDTVVVMEAMKMENNIGAHGAGVITKILVSPGQQVEGGSTLVSIE